MKREDGVDALMEASRALVAVAARSLAPVEDEVTIVQFRALVTLWARGALNLTELADDLGIRPSTATRLCDRLVAKALIARDESPGDRRQLELRLLPAGRSLVDGVYERRHRELASILRAIPADQRAAVVEAFQVFSAAVPHSRDDVGGVWPARSEGREGR